MPFFFFNLKVWKTNSVLSHPTASPINTLWVYTLKRVCVEGGVFCFSSSP